MGDTLKNPQLAVTLEAVKTNPDDFYTGPLSRKVSKDIQDMGGIVSEKDLNDYMISVKPTIKFDFDNLKLHSMPAPGSGAVLAMIINIMHGKYIHVGIPFDKTRLHCHIFGSF